MRPVKGLYEFVAGHSGGGTNKTGRSIDLSMAVNYIEMENQFAGFEAKFLKGWLESKRNEKAMVEMRFRERTQGPEKKLPAGHGV